MGAGPSQTKRPAPVLLAHRNAYFDSASEATTVEAGRQRTIPDDRTTDDER
jgi:hypothetical protein